MKPLKTRINPLLIVLLPLMVFVPALTLLAVFNDLPWYWLVCIIIGQGAGVAFAIIIGIDYRKHRTTQAISHLRHLASESLKNNNKNPNSDYQIGIRVGLKTAVEEMKRIDKNG